MKIILLIALLLSFSFLSCSTNNTKSENQLEIKIDSAINRAIEQSLLLAESLNDQPDQLPVSINKKGELVTSNSRWWVSGFFPGVLWYLYEYSNDSLLKNYAKEFSNRVEVEKNRTWDHDIGFIIFCSFGNGYRITGNSEYKEVIKTAAESLTTRYDSVTGCILSWDSASWNNQWEYPVIIDNMMNLELLMWASKEFNQPIFKTIAENHANKTLTNHYRADNSSYHVVSYNTISGKPIVKQTSQGYSDESAWARGQSWGLYGFTMMFRESGDSIYLNQAIKIADFLIHHLNMPADYIPYWDYNAPGIPNELRDASAGAIMCSALLELSTLAKEPKASEYLNIAEKQLNILCSNQYLSEKGESKGFILKHGVGHMPNKTEIDVPLSYADYYFVEALMRYKKIINN